MKKKTKGIFKVEILKKCKICGGRITEKRFRTYCSKKCRDKNYTIEYKDYRAKWQLARYDRIAEVPAKNKIQCLICNKWYVQVGSHIWNRHNMTAREYREQYGFDVKKGQLPEDYRKLKADQAIECGGYKNLKKGKKYWFKKGQEGPGKYTRSDETLERLKSIAGKHNPKKNSKGKCLVCSNVLTGNQTKYCCYDCRRKDYKIIYNHHKVRLFTK